MTCGKAPTSRWRKEVLERERVAGKRGSLRKNARVCRRKRKMRAS